MKLNLRMFTKTVAICLVSAQLASADVARDCRGMLNGAAVLIGIMELATLDYKTAKGAGDKAGMSNAKTAYINARGRFSRIRTDYSRPPPCGKGSGDLLEDLGRDRMPDFPK